MYKLPRIKLKYKCKSRKPVIINNGNVAKEVCRLVFKEDTIQLKETFYVIVLNRTGCLLGVNKLSEGSSTQTSVDLKHIAALAILSNAASVIITHNHPSGGVKPSQTDLLITKRIYDALDLFSIKLLDHVIVTKRKAFSFAENGISLNKI